ncbi:hypothetical protein GCM10025780_37780 [Frondihabitans cladoniiphilus]|uniref:HNH endonuclease n=1 Tax=Frondihabitans cladoniiphilus TaxID=715785 RepID=A0ABP8WDR1_9MICO
MNRPRWNDPAFPGGTMVRSALWLLDVVGEGNIFTKEQLRSAFPGVSQVDRRVRDLRDYGWVMDTNSVDATLTADEQRFVTAGVEVWDPVARRAVEHRQASVSAKQRAAVFAADSYQCVLCGVAGGESYIDNQSETAVLAVTRREVTLSDGTPSVQLVTECKRCRSGLRGTGPNQIDVEQLLVELSEEDLERLSRWARRGRRSATSLDKAWNALRRMPTVDRNLLLERLSR